MEHNTSGIRNETNNNENLCHDFEHFVGATLKAYTHAFLGVA